MRKSLGIAMLAVALLSSSITNANPPVIYSVSERLFTDDFVTGFGRSVDIDGDIAVIGVTEGGTEVGQERGGYAYIFEREDRGPSPAVWMQTTQLVPTAGGYNFGISVAIEGTTVVVGSMRANLAYVFERTSAGWVRTALLNARGHQVAISNGIIMVSDVQGAKLFHRTSSGWALLRMLNNGYAPNDPNYPGAAVDISSTTAVHGSYGVASSQPGSPPGEAYIYSRTGSDWLSTSLAIVRRPNAGVGADGFSNIAAISGNIAVIGGAGSYLFERNAQGAWNPVQLALPDLFHTVDGNTVVSETQPGTLRLYRRNSSGVWSHAATLVDTDSAGLQSPRLKGNRVIASGPIDDAYIIDIPSVLPSTFLVNENLEDGQAQGWTPAGTPTFAVTNVDGTNVYRQSNMTADARAVFGDVAQDQAIEVDIIPRGVNGPDRWVGIAMRYVDPNNHYYVTWRSSGALQFKRVLNGQTQLLAHLPSTPFVIGQRLRLRLETSGNAMAVHINGRMWRQVPPQPEGPIGRVALMTYKASADFDNILVGPDRTIDLANVRFAPGDERHWQLQGEGNWAIQNIPFSGDYLYHQESTVGGARAVAGLPETDQVVGATVQPLAFNGADRWVGVMARYVDDNNYYYLTLRSNNTVSLRKLTNGAITTLDTASFPVSTGNSYRVRLSVVGNALLGYVNDQLLVEAIDTSAPHTVGRHGLAMYKTRADFDDYLVTQP
ncbi:MAG: hypothetical protein ABW110_02905 [Steroidobacteraceae bacterium]